MQKSDNIDILMQKIEETHHLFKLTVEIIPFLADLFQFLKDMLPLLSEANLSILESTQNLPTAFHRISDVNQATEMATQEILDQLDVISAKLNLLGHFLPPDKVPEIETIQDEVSRIIYALQFQDITSQKLDHANRILNAIYAKFMHVFKTAEKLSTNSQVGEQIIKDIQENSACGEINQQHQELKKQIADTLRHDGFTQEDIDKYFK